MPESLSNVMPGIGLSGYSHSLTILRLGKEKHPASVSLTGCLISFHDR